MFTFFEKGVAKSLCIFLNCSVTKMVLSKILKNFKEKYVLTLYFEKIFGGVYFEKIFDS